MKKQRKKKVQVPTSTTKALKRHGCFDVSLRTDNLCFKSRLNSPKTPVVIAHILDSPTLADNVF